MNPMNFAYFNQFQMNQMNQMGPLQGYVPPMHPMNFYDLDPSQQRFMVTLLNNHRYEFKTNTNFNFFF